MHETDCPKERVRLCLLGVRNMYGGSLLKVGERPCPAREFLDATIGLLGHARIELVHHAEHDAMVASSDYREAAWTAYATAMENKMGDATSIVASSSEAWLAERRKFHELTTSVRALKETIERQASSLTNVSEALRSVGEAAPCPSSRSDGVASQSYDPVARRRVAMAPMSPEVRRFR